MLYSTNRINEVPSSRGLYAWYVIPRISEGEITALISKLSHQEFFTEKRKLISDFILNKLLLTFKRRNLQIEITGNLEATYQGEIAHNQRVSDSLIDTITSDPQVLYILREYLRSKQVQAFFSPVYIGMSTDLNKRLRQHLTGIDNLLHSAGPLISYKNLDAIDVDDDSYFALQVVQRKISKSDLYFSFETMPECSKSGLHAIENLLNRINFPNFGSN